MLKARLAAERLVAVYETLERPLVPALTDMEYAGILVDRSVLSRLTSTFAQSIARLEERRSTVSSARNSISAHPSSSANCCSTA